MMEKNKDEIKKIFDPISKRYDFLNHFLSFGLDYYWRYKATKLTKINKNAILLDVACGTGDFSINARNKGVKTIYGLDLSAEMLKVFHQKAQWSRGKIIQSVAEEIPFKNNSFTNIYAAFGVRNFYDIERSFSEFFRILTHGGKVTILELRLPQNEFLKKLYNIYFLNVLPILGKIISKNDNSYTYLPNSVKDFDERINPSELLCKAGFKKVRTYSLTFGIVQCVIGEKI